ncbi:MAG: twin-arginine translocase TatA/TatE family subunit [Anaerolineae bacterium]
MAFLGIGTGELIAILAITALVVGPEKMVKLARDAGRLLAKLRQETEGIRGEFADALDFDVDDMVREIKQIGQEAQEIKSELEGALDVTGQAKPRTERPSPSARPMPQRTPSRAEPSFRPADQESADAEPVELRDVEFVPDDDQEAEPVNLAGVTTVEEEQPSEGSQDEREG